MRIVFKLSEVRVGVSDNNFIVRESKSTMLIMILCVLFFGACIMLMFIFPNDTVDWWGYLIFSLLFLLGVYGLLRYIFWRIEVKGNEFCYTSFLALKKKFTLNSISKVKIKNPDSPYQKITIFSGTKKILPVESNCIGYNLLVEYLIQEHIAFE